MISLSFTLFSWMALSFLLSPLIGGFSSWQVRTDAPQFKSHGPKRLPIRVVAQSPGWRPTATVRASHRCTASAHHPAARSRDAITRSRL